MIIENGFVCLITTTGGGLQNGIPIPVKEEVGTPIPCNIRTVRHDRKGSSVDSVFTQHSYDVLVDSVIMPRFEAEKVLLIDNRNNELGQFDVQDVQHLDFAGAIKIVV